MAKFEIEVYKCDVCGEVLTEFDIDEHCMWSDLLPALKGEGSP